MRPSQRFDIAGKHIFLFVLEIAPRLVKRLLSEVYLLLLGSIGSSWVLLCFAGNSWALLGASGESERSWALRGAPVNLWALLKASKRSWELLGVPGDFCAQAHGFPWEAVFLHRRTASHAPMLFLCTCAQIP